MHNVRPSSLEEYACWYLEREARKGDSRPIPDGPDQQVQAMWHRHDGKMRPWFTASSRWHIVLLEATSDLPKLVFLECPWTKEERLVIPGGPNYRLLGRVALNATAGDYLDRPSAHKHKAYYDELAAGALRLKDEDRVAICSAEDSEIRSNPDARYYLLDGVGRCLPYMILMTEQKREHALIEAFLAER
jgi:hypothetical protein